MTENRNDTPIASSKRAKSNHWVAAVPSLVIPVCIGLSMHLGLSYFVEQSIITNELLIRYTTGHPISQVTTAMFFRPGGESTQQKGVPAHIIVPSVFNTDQYGEKNQDYSLPSRTTTPLSARDSQTMRFDGNS